MDATNESDAYAGLKNTFDIKKISTFASWHKFL